MKAGDYKQATGRIKDAERQVYCIESRLAAVDDCLQQQLNVPSRLLLERACEERMELAPTGGRQQGFS